MPGSSDFHSPDGVQAQPPWTDPNLPPTSFFTADWGRGRSRHRLTP